MRDVGSFYARLGSFPTQDVMDCPDASTTEVLLTVKHGVDNETEGVGFCGLVFYKSVGLGEGMRINSLVYLGLCAPRERERWK